MVTKATTTSKVTATEHRMSSFPKSIPLLPNQEINSGSATEGTSEGRPLHLRMPREENFRSARVGRLSFSAPQS
jgi:hypothetical protein